VNVFPSEVEAALLDVDGLAPHYQLRLERPRALDVLIVEIEAASPAADRDALAATASARLDRALGLGAEVRVLAQGGVPRSEGKALRVVDAREL
jgi:phenylacetate-CoA ligase